MYRLMGIFLSLLISSSVSAATQNYFRLDTIKASGRGYYKPNTSVTVKAQNPLVGQEFNQWVGSTEFLTDKFAAQTSVKMPAKNISIEATYKPIASQLYRVAIDGGIVEGFYTEGERVEIYPLFPDWPLEFNGWEGDIDLLEDPKAEVGVFIMPARNVKFKSTWKDPTPPVDPEEPTDPEEPADRRPYLGVTMKIPGRIEAENFDEGGDSIAFRDSDSANQESPRPSDDVDLYPFEGDYVLGSTRSGEWTEYTVDILEDETYIIVARIASANGGSTMELQMDGKSIGVISFPKTGGWRSFINLNLPAVELSKGSHILRVFMESPDVQGYHGDLDHLDFIKKSDLPTFPTNNLKILAMGDSNTKGVGNPSGESRDDYIIGYRKKFKEILSKSGISSDMLGSLRAGCASFSDCEHEGYSGKGIDQLAARVKQGIIESYKPDFILLLIGPNDMWISVNDRRPISDSKANERVQALGNLIDEIHKRKSSAHIIVAKPATPSSAIRPRDILRSGIDKLVSDRKNAGREISVVDFLDTSNDGTHYRPAGFEVIADRWFKAIKARLGI